MNNQTPATTHSKLFYGYVIVIAAFCIMFISYGTRYAFGVFFKPVMNEFDWSRAATSGAFSLSSFLGGFIGIAIGSIVDRVGPKAISIFCGFVLGVGYLAMSQVSEIWHLYVFYGFLIGIGMSGIWIPLLTTVARWFISRRSVMSGIVLTGSAIGGLVGPPFANWLILTYDWRLSHIITGVAILVIMMIASQFLKRDPGKVGQKPYLITRKGEKEPRGDVRGFSFKEAFATRQFWLAWGIFFCFGFSMFTNIVHLAAHTTDLGNSPSTAANVLAAMGGLAIAGRNVLGILADKVGNRKVFIFGFIVSAAAMAWLSFLNETWSLFSFAVMVGFVQGGMGTSESPLVAWLFGLKSLSLIFAATSLGFTWGAAAGPFIAGYIFDTTGSYQNAFLLCAFINVVGLILAFWLKPVGVRQSQT